MDLDLSLTAAAAPAPGAPASGAPASGAPASTSTSADASTDAAATRKARRAAGRAARTDAPIDEQAALGPGDRDAVAILESQALTRVPELIAIRYGRMGASPFAFLRGAAAVMARDLRERGTSGLTTQLCGDAHLANVGLYASPERSLVLDLNDFDETATGPFEWDVKRMAASFEVAARARGFDDATRRRVVERMVHAYATAIDEAARTPTMALFSSHIDARAVLTSLAGRVPARAAKRGLKLIEKTVGRDSRSAAASLAEEVDGELRFRLDAPLVLPLRELIERQGVDPDDVRQRISGILSGYERSLPPHRRSILARYRPVDLALKVVGVGSVGTRAWIVLLRGNGRDDLLVLQAKEAQRSVLEPEDEPSAYEHQGRRVVEGAHLMQALSDVLLGWTSAEGLDGRHRDFYVRQFRDWKGSFAPERMEPDTMLLYAEYCGLVLARAHARGGDAAPIAGYVGGGRAFAAALAAFAAAYADRTEADHAALLAAVADGRIESQLA
ncbi:DUF2252 domain-containing protein [Agromyces aerolatus]|uniref:DUF2252 domain-containing protein n=1 Tax=Agromyces sp. LY-1074 TaxID=3074080 RepID=UPI0028673571|nr:MULTISPECIES: DUF2252 domain-containing protein [unclassified Agromyces]MDR5701089.1 DUF2252 domain-containing protein [Agromyces sp. LY-1074]MDR5707729.1 DUF2252 domain-containing protein [Agromyces sp. LY-1358]